MRSARRFLTTVIVLAAMASMLLAQRGGFRNFGQFGRRAFGYYEQNEPPATEFVFARVHYGTNGYRGGGGWYHDYPTAEQHILQIMKEASGLDVDRMSYRIVELSNPEIFKYPFAYFSEPGEMWLTDEEVVNLREYINRGGFMMFDDFDEHDRPPSLEILRANLKRAFPDREMFRLPDTHLLLHNFYDINNLNVTHPMIGIPGIFYGFPDEKGELCMIICWNNDVGDFWEWIDEPLYAVNPSKEALKLGINFIMYDLTH